MSEAIREYTLFLLKSPSSNWTNENITAIKKLLHEESLNWDGGKIIQSLDLISQSHTLELLNIFPELLDDWFSSNFSDREKKIPKMLRDPLFPSEKSPNSTEKSGIISFTLPAKLA